MVFSEMYKRTKKLVRDLEAMKTRKQRERAAIISTPFYLKH